MSSNSMSPTVDPHLTDAAIGSSNLREELLDEGLPSPKTNPAPTIDGEAYLALEGKEPRLQEPLDRIWLSADFRIKARAYLRGRFPWAREYDEDVTQDSIWFYLTHGGDPKSDKNFRWFVNRYYRSFKNIAWSYVAHQRAEVPLPSSVYEDGFIGGKAVIDTGAEFEEAVIEEMDTTAWIRRLPIGEHYRQALLEYHRADHVPKIAIDAIHEKFGISKETAKKRLQRARKKAENCQGRLKAS